MKKPINAFFMAFSMYSAIPCPYHPWDEDARPLMLVFLPVVGAVFGAIWYALAYLMRYASLPVFITAAILTLCPWALSGFLHLDGFMDCCDAIMSRRDLAERQRILKDSHTGAFAVISMVTLAMLAFAIFASMPENTDYLALIFIPTAARCVSAIACEIIKPLSHSHYSGNFKKNQKRSHVVALAVMLVLAIWIPQAFCSLRTMIAPTAAALGAAVAIVSAVRNLGGMSGDIAGFGTTVGEVAGAAGLLAAYLIK